MKIDRERLIVVFTELGRQLETFGQDDLSREVIARAAEENGWFTQDDIITAVANIRAKMLSEDALREWIAAYTTMRTPREVTPKNIGVIMAGNIPLVGFFDLLCVLISGHRLYYKASSKDTSLIDCIIALLRAVNPQLPIHKLDGQPIDAIIATGSNNTNRYFRSRYGAIPAIFRGSRSSVAILDGSETGDELAGLAHDIFTYSGLGCRNVSHFIVPPGYDFHGLMQTLNLWYPVNTKYINNFRQRSSMLAVEGRPHTTGTFYVLRESGEFPSYISEITWQVLGSRQETEQWLADNDCRIQCVVGQTDHPRGAGFGRSQSPGLADYPDAVDVMAFLASI